VAIPTPTALVIAAWKFGGPEGEKVQGLESGNLTSDASTLRPKGTARLVVRANDGSSWMEVRASSSSGKLLYSGTLEQDQRKSFEGKSLQLALAKPQNVVVRLNGNRVELPQGTTFVVTSQRIVRAPS
jgi:RodZ C-terminal domain